MGAKACSAANTAEATSEKRKTVLDMTRVMLDPAVEELSGQRGTADFVNMPQREAPTQVL